MSIRKIQFHTIVLAGLLMSLAYSPVRADGANGDAPATANGTATTASVPTAPAVATTNATNRGGLLPGETREQKRERLLTGIEAQVGPLAPTQRTHILAILAAAGDEMAAARADTMLTEEQQSTVISRVHSEIFTRISAALTPDQQAKLNENHGGMGGGMGMGSNESLEQRRERLLNRYEQLSDLTVKQKSDLMAITDASYKEMEVTNGNATLTADQKRAMLRQIHSDTDVKINAVLTPAQREQWQKIQAQFRAGRSAQPEAKPLVAARN